MLATPNQLASCSSSHEYLFRFRLCSKIERSQTDVSTPGFLTNLTLRHRGCNSGNKLCVYVNFFFFLRLPFTRIWTTRLSFENIRIFIIKNRFFFFNDIYPTRILNGTFNGNWRVSLDFLWKGRENCLIRSIRNNRVIENGTHWKFRIKGAASSIKFIRIYPD